MSRSIRPRIPRGEAEMVDALRRHVALLTDYAERAFLHGDEAYLGEVAGKLRLLVARFRSNTPLLLQLMEQTGLHVHVVLDDPLAPKKQVPLEAFLSQSAVAVRTVSGEMATFTRIDFIRSWAEQSGAPHEDWSMDEGFRTALAFPLSVGGIQASTRMLRAITNTVLSVASHFLRLVEQRDTLKPGGDAPDV